MVKETESNGMGIASMVLGIIGIFVSWIPLLGAPFCVVGLALGLFQKNWTDKPIAITGVTLNGIFVFIQFVWMLLMIIGFASGA